MKSKNFGLVAVCCALLFPAIGLTAEQTSTRFYAGISGGFTVNELFGSDGTEDTYKLFGGMDFNKNFSVEAGFFNPVKTNSLGLGKTEDGKAIYAAAVGRVPLGSRLEWFGKLGLHRWDVKTTTSLGVTTDDSGISAMGGVGVRFNFTPNFAAQLELESYNNFGGESVWTYLLGVRLAF